MEFERILSATGPFQGHVMRPFDRDEPTKIAWLQCVGSRDEKTNPYCSGVCCMYAIKQAVIAKEHCKTFTLDTTIFFMDMRTHGKDFEKYYCAGRKGKRRALYPLPDSQPGPRPRDRQYPHSLYV